MAGFRHEYVQELREKYKNEDVLKRLKREVTEATSTDEVLKIMHRYEMYMAIVNAESENKK